MATYAFEVFFRGGTNASGFTTANAGTPAAMTEARAIGEKANLGNVSYDAFCAPGNVIISSNWDDLLAAVELLVTPVVGQLAGQSDSTSVVTNYNWNGQTATDYAAFIEGALGSLLDDPIGSAWDTTDTLFGATGWAYETYTGVAGGNYRRMLSGIALFDTAGTPDSTGEVFIDPTPGAVSIFAPMGAFYRIEDADGDKASVIADFEAGGATVTEAGEDPPPPDPDPEPVPPEVITPPGWVVGDFEVESNFNLLFELTLEDSFKLRASDYTGVLNRLIERLTVELKLYADRDNAANYGLLDANRNTITNLAEGTEDDDLVTLAQVQTRLGIS